MLDDILNSVVTDSIMKKKIITQENEIVKVSDLSELIQVSNYLGEVVDINYSEAIIQVSDYSKQMVKGVQPQSFIVGSRINPCNFEDSDPNVVNEEDCCVILFRVLENAELPSDMDRKRIRAETAELMDVQSGHWEEQLDASSKRLMSFSGLKCRIIGTFYLNENNGKLALNFGSDMSNYYPNRGLKVYKPTGKALESIVNFGIDTKNSIEVGKVRYASTRRSDDGVSNVSVKIDPTDLIAQKSAVFGMTRTGKSNTVKTIVKSIYQLRFSNENHQRIGQIIFDPNGEYANENLQDKDDKTGEAQAIRNLWKIPVNSQIGEAEDVQIYSLGEHKNDPTRKIMKINFYDTKLTQIGKDLIDNKIEGDGAGVSSHYIRNFLNLTFVEPEATDSAQTTRFERKLLLYRTLLAKSDFTPPNGGVVLQNNLFSKDFLEALSIGIADYESLEDKERSKFDDKKRKYNECYESLFELSNSGSTYYKLQKTFKILNEYLNDPDSAYHKFNRNYIRKNEGGLGWADNDTEVLLAMFAYSNASRQIAKANVFHNSNSAKGDYADLIYRDLSEGKLVIVDQALGDMQMNRIAANRILSKIFNENSKKFSEAKEPSNILIFVEEAHNLMPRGSDEDNTNIWARVAKEGAKFKIGMIYSTQEVSSIQRNILKNTTNWFISHLNNKEEIKALETYYDFEDFSKSILYSEDKGFIRMKTRSNRFVVPIQVEKFQVR